VIENAMLKLKSPATWAQHRTPAEWADHHLKVVLLLTGIAVFGSYPVGVFVLDALTAAGHARDASAASPARPIGGSGLVLAMNDSTGTITIQHAGVPALGLQPGVTGFRASAPILKRTEVGDRLDFQLSRQDGIYVITSVRNPVLGDGTIPG
jgi:Cu/Ag efflux protein CusF